MQVRVAAVEMVNAGTNPNAPIPGCLQGSSYRKNCTARNRPGNEGKTRGTLKGKCYWFVHCLVGIYECPCINCLPRYPFYVCLPCYLKGLNRKYLL